MINLKKLSLSCLHKSYRLSQVRYLRTRRKNFLTSNVDIDTKECAEELLKNSATFRADEEVSPDEQWSSSAYPLNNHKNKSKRQDPAEEYWEDKTVFLFPGQGSQRVGMGKSLLETPGVVDMYSEASEVLGYDLLKLCLQGPKTTLDRTLYCQPATVVTSLAAVEKLFFDHPEKVENCVKCAGFSVGEFTALAFSGVLTLADCVRLVKVRAEGMQRCSDEVSSGMMTVFCGADSQLGLATDVAKRVAAKSGVSSPVCSVANYLYPTTKVVAGNTECLEFIEKNKADFAIRGTKRLPVSGAFHTALMNPCLDEFKKLLNDTEVKDPLIEVYSNCKGSSYTSARDIRKHLPKQIVKAVKWEQILHNIYDVSKNTEVFPTTYECGPGNVLKSILLKINLRVARNCHNITAFD